MKRRTSRVCRTAIICSLLMIAGCAGRPAEEPAPEPPFTWETKQAISSVNQTIPAPPEVVHRTALAVLQQHRLQVAHSDSARGSIVTDWRAITDQPCGQFVMSGAPLPCRLKLRMQVAPAPGGSTLQTSYTELCTQNEEVAMKCPGSTAEMIMLDVVREIAAHALDIERP